LSFDLTAIRTTRNEFPRRRTINRDGALASNIAKSHLKKKKKTNIKSRGRVACFLSIETEIETFSPPAPISGF
jgi:uncharacterized protein with NRDE domain